MNTKNRSLVSELGLLFITVIWGSAFVVVKNTTASIPPSYIIAIRFGIAALLMPVFFFNRIKKIDLRSIKSGAILGILLYAAYYFQTLGIEYTTAGNNAFLTAVYVVLVPFLYWITKNQKPDICNILSAFVCIIGIGFLSLHSGFSVNIGDMLSLLCGAVFAAQITGVSILTEKTDPILLSFTQFTFTSLAALLVSLFTERFPASLGMDSVWALLYVGIFSTLVALVLQNVCQKYVPPSKASLIMSLESLFGTLFGILFLEESLTARTFIGCLLIFAAILISELKPSFLIGRKGKVNREANSLSESADPQR
ncbi:MAG TPA: EamA family transporter [Ruminiclostridium sp.]|nr:EamA family transporter [Ruminiclostridium sp.]